MLQSYLIILLLSAIDGLVLLIACIHFLGCYSLLLVGLGAGSSWLISTIYHALIPSKPSIKG